MQDNVFSGRGYTFNIRKRNPPTHRLQLSIDRGGDNRYLRFENLLFSYSNLYWSLVYIFKEYGKGNEEGNTDKIFYPFDVGVVINQSMQRLNHPDCDHILPCELTY